MNDSLPAVIAQGATLRGNEYGWESDSFPNALAQAEALGYGCLGGQFQFVLQDATCEMYWLNADSSERRKGEAWFTYSRRSCSEVLVGFQRLVPTRISRKKLRNGHSSRQLWRAVWIQCPLSSLLHISLTRLKSVLALLCNGSAGAYEVGAVENFLRSRPRCKLQVRGVTSNPSR
jgi:hypothetical protein